MSDRDAHTLPHATRDAYARLEEARLRCEELTVHAATDEHADASGDAWRRGLDFLEKA